MPDFGRWNSNGGDPSLNEINRADRFIDALASQQPVYSTDPGEAELAQLLAGWRDEIRTPPLMAPVTPRDASVALRRAVESRKRSRTSFAVVGSVAAAVLCLGGFGALVAGAGPGDPLYGVHTMLFGEQPQTRQDAVMLASQQIAEVQQLIDQGQWQAAQDKLQTLTTTVATVNDVEQKQQLVTQWQELTVKVDSQDASATLPPGAPAPTFPDLPAVVAPETTTSESSTPPSETTTSPSETTSPTSPTTPTSSTAPTSETSGTSSTSPTAPSTTTSPSAGTSPTSPTAATTTTAAQEPATTTPGTTTSAAPATSATTTTAAAPPPTATTTTTVVGAPAAGAPAGGGPIANSPEEGALAAPPATAAPPAQAPRQAATPPQAPAVESPRSRAPQSPPSQGSVTVNVPTTTTIVGLPPNAGGTG